MLRLAASGLIVAVALQCSCYQHEGRFASSHPATSESVFCTLSYVKFIHFVEDDLWCFDDNKLCDPITNIDMEIMLWVEVYKDNLDLASIIAVDEAGRIHNADAMACCKAASWHNKACMIFIERNGDATGHESPLERLERELDR